jgi:outer membrane receptor for Fe3+-dicitrate
VNYQSVPVAVDGFGDLGRTPMFSQTNLLFSHTFRLPRNMGLNVQLNVINLFDQDTVTSFDTSPFLRGSLAFAGDEVGDYHEFFNGFDWRARMAQLHAEDEDIGAPDPRYGNGKGTGFQSARSVRVYARFQF